MNILVGPKIVHAGSPTLYHDIVRRFAEHADDTALSHGNRSISYGTLGEQTARIRDELIKAGVRHGQLVPIVTHGGPGMIAAMLGVWAAHAAFVPLAANDSAARRDLALSQVASPIVLVDRLEDRIDRQNCIPIDELWVGAPPLQPLDPTDGPQGEDIAYGFFTSGSTGVPKCCLNVHSGLVNRARAMSRRFDLQPNEAVLQNSSHVFDSSLWQIFWPLAEGAEVAIPQREGILDLHATLKQIETRHVVMTDFVPSILEKLIQLLQCSKKAQAQMASMRFLLVGGEALSLDLLRNFIRLLPHIRLVNTYGPTEASIGMVFHEFTGNEQRVPLGLPIDNTAAAVVDEILRPVSRGEVGEIVIGGACIGRGYLGDPDKTATAFRRDTSLPLGSDVVYRTGDMGHIGEDGLLYFDGRLDDQVKIGGVRVELGEIEHHMRGFPGIHHAKVVSVERDSGVWLAGFYIASRKFSTHALQDHLAAALSKSSVPAVLKEVDDFPLTTSGKVDGKALIATHCIANGQSAAEADSTCAQLLGFVRDLVPWRNITIDDDLVDAGLDSLAMLSLVLESEKITGRTISVNAFLDTPTISGLLGGCGSNLSSGSEESLLRHDIEVLSRLPCPALSPTSTEPAREIVLTGATGYVGQALLRALLHYRQARITCIVRADNNQAATKRLLSQLPDLPLERVSVVAGDLASDKPDKLLPNSTKVIVHAAAEVNVSKNYNQLREANVSATAMLCSFALASGSRFHYISSVAALAGGSLMPDVDGNLPGDYFSFDILRTGYAQTKWTAEQLIQSFRKRGLEANIYRLGEMMPDRLYPISNPKAIFSILCRAARLVGAIPILEEVSDYTPLGVVAKWVAEQVFSDGIEHGNMSVTLVSPTSIALTEMFRAVLGPLRSLSLPEFREALTEQLRTTGNQDAARCLVLLRDEGPADGLRMFQSPEFLRILGRATSCDSIRWPIVHAQTLPALLEPVRRASSAYVH